MEVVLNNGVRLEQSVVDEIFSRIQAAAANYPGPQVLLQFADLAAGRRTVIKHPTASDILFEHGLITNSDRQAPITAADIKDEPTRNVSASSIGRPEASIVIQRPYVL